MGVNGLWPALDQASTPVTAEDLRGKVLAVDLSIWLVEACTSKLLRTVDALRRWRDEDGDDSVVDLCDDDADADDGEIAAYCAARKWPPEDLVATYLADEPTERRAFRWRRPSVDALAFANAERCVHGFHARPSLRYVLARVARLVD